MTTAVVGLGRMGSAMARRLGAAGFDLVLWNRSGDAAARLADELGSSAATTPSEAAERADVVVASLADDAALEAVHAGPDGTLAGVRAGAVVVDTSTVSPGTSEALAKKFATAGAAFLDAPVSGSTALVDQGTLTIMVGGDAAALDQARPVLETLGSKIFHLGPNGTGATMKLAVNALVHAINLALSESLVLAERAGLDRRQAYEVFASGAAGSPYVHYKRAAFEDPDNAPLAFTLDLVAKDMALINALADRLGVPSPQAETTTRIVAETVAAGMGADDMSAIATYFRSAVG